MVGKIVVLRETTGLLANLTSLAAVVVSPGHDAARVASLQLVPLGERLILEVVVLSNGVVEKHTIEPDVALDEAQLARAHGAASAALVGSTLDSATEPAPTGDRAVDDVATLAVRLAQGESESERIYVGGASGLVERFEGIEQVSQVLRLLEEQYVMVGLLQELLDRGLSVAIGTETGLEPLAECSVVVAPYDIEGEPAGTIGLLGPTRMNYPQALAAVAVVSRRLGRTLSES
jgi:heat-inducible transcriptional repressor